MFAWYLVRNMMMSCNVLYLQDNVNDLQNARKIQLGRSPTVENI